MFELPLVKDQLRLIAGARAEYSYIQLDIVDQNQQTAEGDPQPHESHARREPRLHAAARHERPLGWSRTVSRPSSASCRPRSIRRRAVLRGFVGNPTLDQTDIESVDAAWEWFFGPYELGVAERASTRRSTPHRAGGASSRARPRSTPFQQNKERRFGASKWRAGRTSAR
jgi:hypothetical protein